MRILRVAAIVVLLLLAGCNESPNLQTILPAPAPTDTYRIYSSFPVKGRFAADSRQIVSAIDLALLEYHAVQASPIIEHVRLRGWDGQEDNPGRDIEVQNAQIAADDPAALAFIGPYTSAGAAASLPVTNRAGLLQIGLAQTWPGLSQSGWDEGEPQRYYPTGTRNYVRLWAPDSAQAEAAAQWASDMGARRFVVVSDGSSYSAGLAEHFRTAARSKGILTSATVEVSMTNVVELMAQITRQSPDALFYAPSSVSLAISLARNIQGNEPRFGIFATDTALDDRFAGSLEAASTTWRVIYNGSTELPSSPEADRFDRAFTRAFQTQPGLHAARAYDATKLILQAISGSSPSRADVLEQVLSTHEYQGAGGGISVNADGDNSIWQMTGYKLDRDHFVKEGTLDSAP